MRWECGSFASCCMNILCCKYRSRGTKVVIQLFQLLIAKSEWIRVYMRATGPIVAQHCKNDPPYHISISELLKYIYFRFLIDKNTPYSIPMPSAYSITDLHENCIFHHQILTKLYWTKLYRYSKINHIRY